MGEIAVLAHREEVADLVHLHRNTLTSSTIRLWVARLGTIVNGYRTTGLRYWRASAGFETTVAREHNASQRDANSPKRSKTSTKEMNMKSPIFTMLGVLALATATTTANAQENTMMNYKASYIKMSAADNQIEKFAQFLTGAAPLVKKTEPGTKLWFALQAPNNKLSIFDIFVDETARNAHFSGVVAGALKKNADALVAGGWDDGVVANIKHSSVLSAKAPVDLYAATTATYIKLQAAPGQSKKLADLLTTAGPIVADTEPGTLFWVALKLDEENFVIFDIFADEAGRKAHFAGQVAGLLNKKSAVLVRGGWGKGVVANVSNYEILAIK
jgi:quinol monooxygenase YgiN